MRKDITGMEFTRLRALKRVGTDRHRKSIWLCICTCGNYKEVVIGSLTSGNTTSCGCAQAEALKKNVESKKKNAFTKHHLRAKASWRWMIDRCVNPNNKDFSIYGGRGISVCQEWMDFKNFVRDMGDPPEKCSIDRINSNGNYEPSNCRWATAKEQARNTRRNVFVQYEGREITVAELSEITRVPASTIYARVSRGVNPL